MKTVYKIFNKKEGKYTGSYSRAYHDVYEFSSPEQALNSNCHDTYHDTDKYEIHEVEIVETLVAPVPPKEEHIAKTKESKEHDRLVDEMMSKGDERLDKWEEASRRMNASLMVGIIKAYDTKPKEEK